MNLFKRFIFANSVLLILFSCKKENDIKLNSGNFTSDASTPVQLITNIKASTSKSYVLSTLSSNVAYYTDRTYQITSFSSALSGASLIKTAQGDKASKVAALLNFTLSEDATVYVGYDSRATAIPSWLQSWTKTKDTLKINDPDVSSLIVYSKAYAAGSVSLGGNMVSPAVGALTNYIVLAVATSTVSLPAEVSSTNGSLMLGVNGHSLGQASYKSLTPATQVSMLKKMGMTGYRQDIDFNSDGTISNLTLFKQLYSATSAAGITILPMVYTKTLDYSSTETAMYAAGKTLGQNVASKNSQYFKYYELGNELDNKVILSGNGDQTSEYNSAKFKIVAAYLKGMNDGIKAVQPEAKTMIDASWLHYAYLQMMVSYGVNFDIIAYHWYSEMEGIAANKSINIPDITVKLSTLFNKPIWFTEVGERYKAVSNINQLQSDFLTEFVAKCRKNPRVQALLLYELLNEPEKNSTLESNYGLVKWLSPFTNWEYKTAAQNLFVN